MPQGAVTMVTRPWRWRDIFCSSGLSRKWQRRGIESEGGSTVVSRAEGEVLANPETLEASECILDGWLVGLHNCRMQ